MTLDEKVPLALLSTGVPGLDEALGGGLPKYSFNLIAGEPGSGKTTLAHQIAFANATPEAPALYFTVIGEPALKMVRYQQQLAFFDLATATQSIHFVNLGDELLGGGLAAVLCAIEKHVRRVNPSLVVVDSFRSVTSGLGGPPGELGLQEFLQRLALFLASWQATTFLIGEYDAVELRTNAIFTISDGILVLSQTCEGSAVTRKLQVSKLRGRAQMLGLHTFRMSADGIEVFPRLHRPASPATRARVRRGGERMSSGVSGLDEMLGGGIPQGDSVMVAGPAGTGKTILGAHFIAEGARRGERGVIAIFEEHPEDYLERARQLGLELGPMIEQGLLQTIYLTPLDLSIDEALHDIGRAVDELGAQRLVIDSLTGFEISLSPGSRADFRESLHRLVRRLLDSDVTVLMTMECVEAFNALRFTPRDVSFLADDLIMLRYVEVDSRLQTMLSVVKMRRSAHSRELRKFEIGSRGLVVDGPLRDYHGILTGTPRPRVAGPPSLPYPGLTELETSVANALIEAGDATTAELVAATSLDRAKVEGALERLLTQRYAERLRKGIRARYRALPLAVATYAPRAI